MKVESWLDKLYRKYFLNEKLNNSIGVFLVAAIALFFGYLIARQELLGLGIFGLIVSFAFLLVCLVNTEAGLYITAGYSFFGFHLNRFLFNDSLQVGIGSDILLVATFLSLFISKRFNREFPRSYVTVAILVLYGYVVLQIGNPYGHSVGAWLQTIRKILAEFLLLYIGYCIFSDRQVIRRFLTVLFILCSIAGVYGCIQQMHGLFDFEMAWLLADPHRFGLTFIAGDFRKFSIMSDPTAFGIAMAASAILFMAIAAYEKKWYRKGILGLGILVMILGMSFSGTRTANAMLIGGVLMFILITFNNRNTRIFAAFATVAFLLLLYGPYSNATINRFRTTFLGSDDASYNVRVMNKRFIQPYIHSHPVGGGLRTTGGAAFQYNPGHQLAGFPPDSGYLKTALELGWIGLILLLVSYFCILRAGFRAYFVTPEKDQLKIVLAGAASLFFSLYVAQYAQDAIGQITDIVIYYPLIGLVLRTIKQRENHPDGLPQ